MSASLIVLLLLSLRVLPASSVSTLEFFSDKSCSTSVGRVNGTTGGACHPAIAHDGSTRVVELDPQCAATIYTDHLCRYSPTVVSLNVCMTGSFIVGSFSIECKTASASSSAAASTATQPSATSAASTSGQNADSHSSAKPITPTILAAIIVGSVVVISVIPLGYAVWRCRARRRGLRPVRLLSHSTVRSEKAAGTLKVNISGPTVTKNEYSLFPTARRDACRSRSTAAFKAAISVPRLEPASVERGEPVEGYSMVPFLISPSMYQHDGTPPPRTSSLTLVSPLTPPTAHVPQRPARGGTWLSPTSSSPSILTPQTALVPDVPSPDDHGSHLPFSDRPPSEGSVWWRCAHTTRTAPRPGSSMEPGTGASRRDYDRTA